MAKKHSSKTATQEALQAANPKIQVFDKWAGVNFKDAPLGWEVEEPSTKFYQHHQTDLPFNNFLIQNNMVTDMSDSVSTRFDSEVIATTPDFFGDPWNINYELYFTGVAYLYRHWIFAAFSNEAHEDQIVAFKDINSQQTDDWYYLPRLSSSLEQTGTTGKTEVYEIDTYENKLFILSKAPANNVNAKCVVYTCDIDYNEKSDLMTLDGKGAAQYLAVTAKAENYIDDPTYMPEIEVYGLEENQWWLPPDDDQDATPPPEKDVAKRYTICYSYNNMWGSTNLSPSRTVWLYEDAWSFTSEVYLKIIERHKPMNVGATGVEIWVNEDEHQDWVLATNFAVKDSTRTWSINWYGAMENTDSDSLAAKRWPQENTTWGPIARHFTHIDSRLYWWGDPDKPYRLTVGGDVGTELSVARGNNGGWVDIEPGTGFVIQGVCKWKTASGANIVTLLCGHPNTSQVKRFNLVEMTSTFTNEIQTKGWEYEEVSNVVGCNSRWGYGVFADGLYSVARYGLMLTTMAMEYNNQMRNQKVSEVIDPIFTERLGYRLNDARMVYIDGIIYLILSETGNPQEPQNLDNVILCYDTGKKAWYTFTHREPRIVNHVTGAKVWDVKPLLHAMPIDSERHVEGLGVISKDAITLYPSTGIQEVSKPEFDIMLETGELCSRVPMQAPYYVEQLEFRFDYFIGDAECEIEGVDYYGRKFKIYKKFGKGNGADGDPENIEKRTYVEWIRVQKLVEFFRIRIKGKCRCRLTHIICKAYLYNNLIGTPYGFDAQDTFINRHGDPEPIHHYIDSYNNLRRAIVT